MEPQQTVEEQSLAILDQATASATLPRQIHFQVIGAIQCLNKFIQANKKTATPVPAPPTPPQLIKKPKTK